MTREERIDRIIERLKRLGMLNVQKLEEMQSINYACTPEIEDTNQLRQARQQKAD